MPSAMAPLETTMALRPMARRRAISPAQRAIASASTPRPSPVTSDEPTLTTSVFASPIIASLRPPSFLRQLARDGAHELLAPLSAQRRDFEPRPAPAQRAHHPLGAFPRIVHQVDLVEHQPARLARERGVVLLQLGANDARIARRVGLAGVDEMQQ